MYISFASYLRKLINTGCSIRQTANLMNTYLIYFNNILRDIILAQSIADAKKQCIRIRRDNKYTGVLTIHSLY